MPVRSFHQDSSLIAASNECCDFVDTKTYTSNHRITFCWFFALDLQFIAFELITWHANMPLIQLSEEIRIFFIWFIRSGIAFFHHFEMLRFFRIEKKAHNESLGAKFIALFCCDIIKQNKNKRIFLKTHKVISVRSKCTVLCVNTWNDFAYEKILLFLCLFLFWFCSYKFT